MEVRIQALTFSGIDVIYDPVGLIKGMPIFVLFLNILYSQLPGFIDSLKCIAWKGRAIVVGFVGGEIEKVHLSEPPPALYSFYAQLPLNLVLLKNISIVGIHWGAYSST